MEFVKKKTTSTGFNEQTLACSAQDQEGDEIIGVAGRVFILNRRDATSEKLRPLHVLRRSPGSLRFRS